MKQAVLVIHGIGEQRPMDTIRGFVEAVLTEKDSKEPAEFWNKPDNISSSYELRRYCSKTTRNRPTTDFYEFYWAHMMTDTKWGHLATWLKALLLANPRNLTNKVKPIWVLSWLLIASSIYFLAKGIIPMDWSFVNKNFFYSIGSFFLLFIVNRIALTYIGDAARYLLPHAGNVEVRQKIRSAGVDILRKLHQSKKYDRIVVVGHSLGSVIGYDILKYLWVDYHHLHGRLEKPKQGALKLFTTAQIPMPEDFQKLQRNLWIEQRNLGNPWLVSDFITLGSPLAHAQFLLSKSKADLKRRHEEKELPCCPPIKDDGQIFFNSDYLTNGKQRTIKTLHHAALFAPTKWTNLYFPGDFIGGPLREQFGEGVYDIKVRAIKKINGHLPTSHTKYWAKLPKGHPKIEEGFGYLSIRALQNALWLDSASWLKEVKPPEPLPTTE